MLSQCRISSGLRSKIVRVQVDDEEHSKMKPRNLNIPVTVSSIIIAIIICGYSIEFTC